MKINDSKRLPDDCHFNSITSSLQKHKYYDAFELEDYLSEFVRSQLVSTTWLYRWGKNGGDDDLDKIIADISPLTGVQGLEEVSINASKYAVDGL